MGAFINISWSCLPSNKIIIVVSIPQTALSCISHIQLHIRIICHISNIHVIILNIPTRYITKLKIDTVYHLRFYHNSNDVIVTLPNPMSLLHNPSTFLTQMPWKGGLGLYNLHPIV